MLKCICFSAIFLTNYLLFVAVNYLLSHLFKYFILTVTKSQGMESCMLAVVGGEGSKVRFSFVHLHNESMVPHSRVNLLMKLRNCDV